MEDQVEMTPERVAVSPAQNYDNSPELIEESNIDVLRRHNVTFNFLNSGCIISVGCKTYAFSSNEEGLSEFVKFVENPKEAWKKWNN